MTDELVQPPGQYLPTNSESIIELAQIIKDNPDRPIFVGLRIVHANLPKHAWENGIFIGCDFVHAHMAERR